MTYVFIIFILIAIVMIVRGISKKKLITGKKNRVIFSELLTYAQSILTFKSNVNSR